MFDCPGKACFRVGVHGFTRKDHLKEHLVNYYGWDPKTRICGPIESGENRERRWDTRTYTHLII